MTTVVRQKYACAGWSGLDRAQILALILYRDLRPTGNRCRGFYHADGGSTQAHRSNNFGIGWSIQLKTEGDQDLRQRIGAQR